MAKTLSVFLTFTTATWEEERGGVRESGWAAGGQGTPEDQGRAIQRRKTAGCQSCTLATRRKLLGGGGERTKMEAREPGGDATEGLQVHPNPNTHPHTHTGSGY